MEKSPAIAMEKSPALRGFSDIYQHLGEAVIKYLGLPCEAINIDTTSFHVDG